MVEDCGDIAASLSKMVIGCGMMRGFKVVIEPHRHEGVFIARGKEDALVTKNLVPGEVVYDEERFTVQVIFVFIISHFDFD